MHVFNIKNLQTVKSNIPIKGSIALREFYGWSRWYKPLNNILFSYQLNHQHSANIVQFEYGKTYTFEDIRQLLGNYFNKLDTVFDLTFDKNGKVNLDFQTSFAFKNLKLCKELAFELRLPYMEKYDNIDDKVTIGTTPIRKEDVQLTFSDTDMLYVSCDEINKTNVIYNNENSTLIGMIPIERDRENKMLLKYKDTRPLFYNLTPYKTIYNLNFTVLSQRGNKLPFTKTRMVILNKR